MRDPTVIRSRSERNPCAIRAQAGNEARFINDFRNTGRKANCAFRERIDARGVRHMVRVKTIRKRN